MGKVLSIVYKPATVEDKPANYFSRLPLQKALLTVEHGIDGDTKGGHPKRQLNVMCQTTLEKLAEEGYQIKPGQLGEQIIIDGFDLTVLAEGNQLQLGEVACIEVVSHRNGCERFETLQGKPIPTKATFGALGIMARVVIAGTIHVGDEVRLLTPVPHG